jgi:primosomal protein N' (replication factor Y)
MYFAEVILPLALNRTFTYTVTEQQYNVLRPGCRVAVPFGRSRVYTALVSQLHQNPPVLYEAKAIQQILDENPVVTEIQLQHWFWISSYYMCPIGDVYRGAMPSAMLLESETIVSAVATGEIKEALTDDEFLVIEALSVQSSLKVADISNILGRRNVFPVIKSLFEKNAVSVGEEVIETYKPKLVRYIRIEPAFDSDEGLQELLQILSRSEKQRDALMAYFHLAATARGKVSQKELVNEAGVTSAVIKGLVQKGIFEEYTVQKDRVSFTESADLSGLQLSTAQQTAVDQIQHALSEKEVCLLHGVTASGKTEIYLKLIESQLLAGRQVLYLLPEIALTTQLVERLTAYFGNQVAVFHSKYSNNERTEVWQRLLAKSDTAKIVIGARSALFLPFHNLGMIIIDEEHEQSFKQQDPAPRYHARDAAIVLAGYHGAKTVLGSATPAIESYYNARTGKYGLAEITSRFGNVMLPEIILVDLKDKYFRKKMTGHFSDVLIEHISEALAAGEQVILFQNRRGYSPFVECLDCGHVPQCTNCDVSLTFHKNKNQLRCHYCGYSVANPTHCHRCSGVNLTTKGFGTEQIQQELTALFPAAKTGRMDQDTTRGKFGFERIIDNFRNRAIDILVGTQMLAKGLDFDNVTVVGIMNADSMLYFPDFRAFERSFQMMTQVAGRAGRASVRGRVVIQTYNPDHNIVRQVTSNDYEGMFQEQLYDRKIYKYPPYFRLVKLTLKHRDFEKLKTAASWLANVLTQQLSMPVLGPEEPPIPRIRNEYIRTVMIKIPNENSLPGTKKTIRRILDSFEAVPQFRPVKVVVNVDYY